MFRGDFTLWDVTRRRWIANEVKLAQWIVVLCLPALAVDTGIRTPEPPYMVT